MNSNEINEHINTSKKIWEEENPIVKSIEEIQILAEHSEELSGKVVTIEGIVVDPKIKEAIYKITENDNLEKIHFNECEINDTSFSVFSGFYFYKTALAITNCNLTAFQGKVLFDGCLCPYYSYEVDFSNNQLGEKGSDFLEFLSNRVEECIVSLNLSGNGFKAEDISKFLETRVSEYDIYFDDIQEIDK
ncbi:hypothetical protein M9Y10_019390 [Tritrichomonas musculus]|uniref:Leucine Rich Repeat family protein n=1 Tax=Tritrichomonas musculus TaxID=1915356 RepID=A0ABR2HKT2_9EUKA